MFAFKKILILFFAVITLLNCDFAQASVPKIQANTVTYAPELQADLFKMSAKKQVPAVILIHGGYWSTGNRQDLSDFAMKLAQNGFLAMTVDYHLLPNFSQKTQTNDIINAIWWLRENASQLGINPEKIGVVGISAGGYLAAWAATHDEVNSKGIKSHVNAIVSLYGPWDLTDDAAKEVSPDTIKLIEQFCAEQNRKTASPLYAISYPMPPVLVIHGDADKIVPVNQSINAYKQLKSVNCKCKFVLVHNDGHCFPNTQSYFNAMNMSIKFLNKVLK